MSRYIEQRLAIYSTLGVALLLLASGCARGTKMARGVIEAGTLRPAAPAVAVYGPSATLTCPSGGALKVLQKGLQDWAKQTGGAVPQPDGRLCAVASTLVGWGDGPAVPPMSVVAFTLAHFGVAESGTRMLFTTVSVEDSKTIGRQLKDSVVEWLAEDPKGTLGLATYRIKKGTTAVALLFLPSAVELAPVPRTLALNASAQLVGKVLPPYEKAVVLASDNSGKLSTTKSEGADFKAELKCTGRPGDIIVEVRAERDGQPRLLDSFTVGCAKPAPANVIVPPAPELPADPAAAEQQLFELANRERAAFGVPQLAADGAIAKLARTIAESLRAQARGGSAPAIDVVGALGEAGVVSSAIVHNPSRSLSISEAQAGFLASPVHRSNMLNPEVTHAGIGVAVDDQEGTKSVFVSELFVRELLPVDVASVRTKLEEAISKRRSEAHASVLTPDETLTDVAQKYAEELAKNFGEVQPKREEDLTAPLFKKFKNAKIIMGANPEPLELVNDGDVVAAGDVVGVGVASGTHRTLGKNTPYVVIFVARKR